MGGYREQAEIIMGIEVPNFSTESEGGPGTLRETPLLM